MVNYAYRPGEIERNHEAFANAGTIACSPAVTRLARQIDIEVPVGGTA